MVYTLTHMRVVLALNYTRFCRIDSIISNKCPINALGGGEAVGTTAISSVRPIWTLVLAVFFFLCLLYTSPPWLAKMTSLASCAARLLSLVPLVPCPPRPCSLVHCSLSLVLCLPSSAVNNICTTYFFIFLLPDLWKKKQRGRERERENVKEHCYVGWDDSSYVTATTLDKMLRSWAQLFQKYNK